MTERITNADKGRWTVTTRRSVYTLDLDAKTICRSTRDGATLRKDNTTVPLLNVFNCRVGGSAVFTLHVAEDDDTETFRATTEIVSIVPVGGGSDD